MNCWCSEEYRIQYGLCYFFFNFCNYAYQKGIPYNFKNLLLHNKGRTIMLKLCIPFDPEIVSGICFKNTNICTKHVCVFVHNCVCIQHRLTVVKH